MNWDQSAKEIFGIPGLRPFQTSVVQALEQKRCPSLSTYWWW